MTTARAARRLTKHFGVSEFDDRHQNLGPPRASLDGLVHLCVHALEPLRRKFGPVRIFSGYRTPTTNGAVGGAPHSHHLYDEWPLSPAADVGCERGSPAEWADFLNQRGVGGLGVYPAHVHVDMRTGRSRW